MKYVVLAPFFNPEPDFQFDTAAEAEAKAAEMVTANPALVATIAEVTFLKTFSASVKVSTSDIASQ